jgi:hypothetical protein
LGWYWRRLRSMPAGEMLARVKRTAVHRWDDITWQRLGGLWARRWQAPADFACRLAPVGPLGFLTAVRASELRTQGPDEVERLVEAADAFIEGRVRFFGYPEARLRRPIDFAVDPFAGTRWPDRHGKHIDYRHIGEGDPKWIWELNRCQYLPLLIQAWLITEQRHYAEAAVDELLSWASQNPPGRGIAWANGYEAGIRAVSISVTFDALRGSAVVSPADEQRLLEILRQHGQWIERDPSTHSSANNHRMGELVGTIAICVLAPEISDTERWFGSAIAELADQARRQIRPDGTGAEMAFAYHVYVVDLLLLAVALLDAAGTPIPQPVMDAIHRSGDAIWAQIGESEPLLTYGDTDDAVSIRLAAAEFRDARAVAASIACRIRHPRARLSARWPDWTSWWMFGDEGVKRFESTAAASRPEGKYLREGGIVLLRRDGVRASIDIGPLGYLSIAAHGHADALAVTLTQINGDDLVIDPGVGSYFRDPEAREAFRGTAFHATVEVDGQPQSEAGGAFLWTRHAKVTAHRVDLGQNLVFAEHDGYQRLHPSVNHRRAVALLAGGQLLVCDLLTTVGPHRYAQNWPLGPALQASLANETGAIYHAAAVAHSEATGPIALRVAATAPGELRLAKGRRQPMLGWWSPRLEGYEPAWLCSWIVQGVATVAMAGIVTLGVTPLAGSVSVAREGATVLVVQTTGDVSRICRVDFERHTLEMTE